MKRSLILAVMVLLAISGLPQAGLSDTPTQSMISKDVYYKTEGVVSGPPAPKLNSGDYPRLNLPSPFGESRIIIWFLAQQHLYFGSFILGILSLVLIFELRGLVTRERETAHRHDDLAHDLIRISLTAYSLTAILGGLLIFGFITLYPDFFRYLAGLFKPWMHIYALLFLAVSGTLYLYYYGWDRMSRGFLKWVHASIGVLLNVFGIALMMLANSWGTFMMSPAGVDAQGRFLGNYWHVLHNALWTPLNIHRITGNIILGASVMAAYAAYQARTARIQRDRAYYDWMGYVSFLIMVFAIFTVPFGGYWLSREIYSYKQLMGIIMFGGLLAWWGVILVFLIGALFVAINYYLWQRIEATGETERYRHYAKYVFFILLVCFLVYVTPHTYVMSPSEVEAIGGQQHPILGNFGVESAKQPAINVMTVVTVWSLIMLWQSRYFTETVIYPIGQPTLVGLFLAGAVNILWLGIYGFYVPANTRVGLSVPMVITTLSIIVFGSVLTLRTVFRTKFIIKPMEWGNLSARGYLTLLFIAVTVTWIMGLGGYRRSSLRLFWHATEVFRDNSPWAFTHTVGFAANVITINVLFFWCALLFTFWLAKLTEAGSR